MSHTSELGSLPVVAEGIKPFVLVIRPHPSEDQAPWIEAARGISNIAVVFGAQFGCELQRTAAAVASAPAGERVAPLP